MGIRALFSDFRCRETAPYDQNKIMLLSIITITYNNLKGLRNTIESIDTTSSDIEHIVVDGNSNDGTQKYLKSLDYAQLKWISESDDGIYDAMNKGLNMANGEYIIYLNSGDRFYSFDTLPKVTHLLSSKWPDVLYGETDMITENGQSIGVRSKVTTRKLPDILTWKSMKRGMLVCHQSFIVRKGIAPPYIVDNLSADIDWQIQCLKGATKIVKTDFIISSFETGGISQQKKWISLQDRAKVLIAHYGPLQTALSHIYFVLRFLRFKVSQILRPS